MTLKAVRQQELKEMHKKGLSIESQKFRMLKSAYNDEDLSGDAFDIFLHYVMTDKTEVSADNFLALKELVDKGYIKSFTYS